MIRVSELLFFMSSLILLSTVIARPKGPWRSFPKAMMRERLLRFARNDSYIKETFY